MCGMCLCRWLSLVAQVLFGLCPHHYSNRYLLPPPPCLFKFRAFEVKIIELVVASFCEGAPSVQGKDDARHLAAGAAAGCTGAPARVVQQSSYWHQLAEGKRGRKRLAHAGATCVEGRNRAQWRTRRRCDERAGVRGSMDSAPSTINPATSFWNSSQDPTSQADSTKIVFPRFPTSDASLLAHPGGDNLHAGDPYITRCRQTGQKTEGGVSAASR